MVVFVFVRLPLTNSDITLSGVSVFVILGASVRTHACNNQKEC